MKKTPFIVLIAAEAAIALVSLGLIFSWFGWIGLVLILAATGAAEAFLVLRCKKQQAEENEQGMKKTRVLIALALLIPTAVAVVTGIYTIISMLLYLG